MMLFAGGTSSALFFFYVYLVGIAGRKGTVILHGTDGESRGRKFCVLFARSRAVVHGDDTRSERMKNADAQVQR
jgi:hypothetical protein